MQSVGLRVLCRSLVAALPLARFDVRLQPCGCEDFHGATQLATGVILSRTSCYHRNPRLAPPVDVAAPLAPLGFCSLNEYVLLINPQIRHLKRLHRPLLLHPVGERKGIIHLIPLEDVQPTVEEDLPARVRHNMPRVDRT